MDIQLVLLCGGLIIACIGTAVYFFNRGREYHHTVKVKGIVTGGDETENGEHITYFSYAADGIEKNTFGYTGNRYAPGQSIELKYDPENPDDCIEAIQEGTDLKPVSGVMMAIGFIMMLIGLLTG